MSDDTFLCERILDLLTYGNIHLSLDTNDNLYLYRKLCSLLGIIPYDPQEYVSDNAVLEKLTGPEQLLQPFPSNIRARLIDVLLPPPSKSIELFNSFLDGGDIRDATDWFYDLSVKSGYIPLEASENNIHWRPAGEKGGLHITINTSIAYDNGCHYDYPRCLSCEGGACDITSRELPVFLKGEDWSFRFSHYSLFNQHFIFFPQKHKAGAADTETYAKLISAAEYFPHYFFAKNAEGSYGYCKDHECFLGGLPQLPLFSAAPRIAFTDPEGFVRVTVPDWYNTVIRLESAQRHAILAMTEKICGAWEKFSDPEIGIVNSRGGKNNVMSSIVRINENGEYCVDLILQNNKLSQSSGLIVPAGGLGVIESAGVFIFPAAIARVAETAYTLLAGNADDAFGQYRDDAELGHYAELLKDIKDKSSGNPQNAESDIENYIEKACEDSLKAAAVFKEDGRGNMALIKFMSGLGLPVKR